MAGHNPRGWQRSRGLDRSGVAVTDDPGREDYRSAALARISCMIAVGVGR
jgi:hypothetical protein